MEVQENRLSALLQSLLLAACLGLSPLLRLIPTAVLVPFPQAVCVALLLRMMRSSILWLCGCTGRSQELVSFTSVPQAWCHCYC